MNSNLSRALSVALLALGGAIPAFAQYDWDRYCVDQSSTNPYSTPFISYLLRTELFGAAIGAVGSVSYNQPNTYCGVGSMPVAGRIGFTLGTVGSIQDNDPNQDFGGLVDDDMRLTPFMNGEQDGPTVGFPGGWASPSGGGHSYARVFTSDPATPATAPTSILFGSTGFSLAYVPASGRFVVLETTLSTTIGVRCEMSVVGDTARFTWRLRNNAATPQNLGLWFGQEVDLTDRNGNSLGVPFQTAAGGTTLPLITIPGRKPLTVHERFPGDVATTVPPYVNFSGGQRFGFGLQVVNSPTVKATQDVNGVSDQTQVDEFVLGEAPFLINGTNFATDPAFNDSIINAVGNGNADAALIGYPPAYIQKWQPSLVGAGGTRTIVTYYRTTSSDSSYSSSFDGYTAVVDPPRAITTDASNPSDFASSQYPIRVTVDNVGGFSTVDRTVAMQSVRVRLNLPSGLFIAGNPGQTTQTKTISRINAGFSGFTDFAISADPEVFGALPYTVEITPQPGFATKTISGTINVAATPRLLIREGANLVSPAWEFESSNWSTVLGLDVNSDFQAYTWDPITQQYVIQNAPERGRGTFVISTSDLGYQALGGTPSQPTDQFPDEDNFYAGGAASIRIRRGWNLVGNPYNYAFVLGGIVGVPNGTTSALTYDDLVGLGYMDGTFAYYDQDNRNYRFIQGTDARLEPNRGYWLYSNQEFELQFPPLYDLFIRSAASRTSTTFRQTRNDWRLQLTASTSKSKDMENYVGVVQSAADVARRQARKAPLAPTTDAVRAFVTGVGANQMAQAVRNTQGRQSYTYNVYTQSAAPVTVAWPNLKEIPSNLAVRVTDLATGRTIDARKTSGYSYSSAARSTRSFAVEVVPQGTVAQRIGTVSSGVFSQGNARVMRINYFLGGRGTATLRVLDKKGKAITTIVSDAIVQAGANTINWGQSDASSTLLPNGTYTLEITAVGEGGDTARKLVSTTVKN